MSDRLRFIAPVTRANPIMLAYCLRKVATALDLADDQTETKFYAGLMTDQLTTDLEVSWSQTALLIADMAEVDSLTLRAMSVTIEIGEQLALFAR